MKLTKPPNSGNGRAHVPRPNSRSAAIGAKPAKKSEADVANGGMKPVTADDANVMNSDVMPATTFAPGGNDSGRQPVIVSGATFTNSDTKPETPDDSNIWTGIDQASALAGDQRINGTHPQRGPQPQDPDSQFEQTFIIARRNLIHAAGGGLAALILARSQYWTGSGADGRPRCRPQPLVMPEGIESDAVWITTSSMMCLNLGLDSAVAAHRKRLLRAIDRLVHAGLLRFRRNVADPWSDSIDLAYPGELVAEVMSSHQHDRWILWPTPNAMELFRSPDNVYRRLYVHWIPLMPTNAAVVLSVLWSMTFGSGVPVVSKIRPIIVAHQGFATMTGLTVKQVRSALPHLLRRQLIVQTTQARGQLLPAWQIEPTSLSKLAPKNGKASASRNGHPSSHNGQASGRNGHQDEY